MCFCISATEVPSQNSRRKNAGREREQGTGQPWKCSRLVDKTILIGLKGRWGERLKGQQIQRPLWSSDRGERAVRSDRTTSSFCFKVQLWSAVLFLCLEQLFLQMGGDHLRGILVKSCTFPAHSETIQSDFPEQDPRSLHFKMHKVSCNFKFEPGVIDPEQNLNSPLLDPNSN